eukprot:scaffold10470_cov124-Isochrysis_galbana.AAC.6
MSLTRPLIDWGLASSRAEPRCRSLSAFLHCSGKWSCISANPKAPSRLPDPLHRRAPSTRHRTSADSSDWSQSRMKSEWVVIPTRSSMVTRPLASRSGLACTHASDASG